MSKPIQFVLSMAALVVAGFSIWQYIQIGDLGEKVEQNGVEIYYTDNVDLAKANELLKFLNENGFADGSQKTLQLDRGDEKTWVVRAVVKEDGAEALKPVFNGFARELSAGVFGGEPVVVHLCNDKLKTHTTLESVSANSVVKEKVEMYYTTTVEKAKAEELLDFLTSDGFSDGNPKTLSLDLQGDKWVLKIVVKAGMDKDEDYAKVLAGYGGVLSTKVFSGAPMELHMTDDMLETIRVVPAVQN